MPQDERRCLDDTGRPETVNHVMRIATHDELAQKHIRELVPPETLHPWAPLVDMIPEPTPEEYAALVESIKADGQRERIKVLADGRIVCGLQRWRVCVELGRVPEYDLLPPQYGADESRALALGVTDNCVRRQLTREQKRELYLRCRRELEWTQEQAATVVGIARSTGSVWETQAQAGAGDKAENATNVMHDISCGSSVESGSTPERDSPPPPSQPAVPRVPDRRRKLSRAEEAELRRRYRAGESAGTLAKCFHVSEQYVREGPRIEKRRQQAAQRRERKTGGAATARRPVSQRTKAHAGSAGAGGARVSGPPTDTSPAPAPAEMAIEYDLDERTTYRIISEEAGVTLVLRPAGRYVLLRFGTQGAWEQFADCVGRHPLPGSGS